MKTWYELFIAFPDGTRTIETFDTLEEAKEAREWVIRGKHVYLDGDIIDIDDPSCLHIDRWEQDGEGATPYPVQGYA